MSGHGAFEAHTESRRLVAALFFRAGQHHVEGVRCGSMIADAAAAPSRIRYAAAQLERASIIAHMACELQEYVRGVR